MSAQLTLSAEFRRLVESQMDQVLRGIEATFSQIIEKQKITPTELKDEVESLQDTFNLLFQKWSLEILYTLMLGNLPYTLLKGAVYIHPTLAEGLFSLMESVKPVD